MRRAGEGQDVESLRSERVWGALNRATRGVVQGAVFTGAVGPIVADVQAGLLAMGIAAAELNVVQDAQISLELAIQAETGDLVMHGVTVQAVVMSGPIRVVIERA